MRTKFLKVMAIIFTVLYGISFLIYLGIMIIPSSSSDTYPYNSFNIGFIVFVIIIMLIYGVVLLTPWYALASLSADNDALLDEQTRIREELHFYFQNQTTKQQPSALKYSYLSSAVHTNNSTTTNTADNKWICNICGELNQNSSRTCKGCGNQK